MNRHASSAFQLCNLINSLYGNYKLIEKSHRKEFLVKELKKDVAYLAHVQVVNISINDLGLSGKNKVVINFNPCLGSKVEG